MIIDVPGILPLLIPDIIVLGLAIAALRRHPVPALLLFGAAGIKVALLAFRIWGAPWIMDSFANNIEIQIVTLRLLPVADIAPWLLVLGAVFYRRGSEESLDSANNR